MTKNSLIYFFYLASMITSCTSLDQNDASITATDLWLAYSKERTQFKLWNPEAEAVQLHLYDEGDGGRPLASHALIMGDNGVWETTLEGDLNGTYYTYQVKTNGNWLDETPGIYARAVGVNGQRAMVLDLNSTNPAGWELDKGPELKQPNDAIIYEVHVRDFTIHPESGISSKGKYLGLTERGARSSAGVATGLDHLKEMGITHVHLLPTSDFASIDETRSDEPQYNWGYDPQNYNVPDGSYATNPYKSEVRIAEFKQMVKTLHDAGIGVIKDVVFNHTGGAFDASNFNLEAPGYYYRYRADGTLSDAAACGNETASDKEMMRKFMIASVTYWAREYHIDGFRFDLMGIHDIETMNAISAALKNINPAILIYGEGWTAGDSPLPVEKRALKAHIGAMPGLSAFSDDIRDGLKGSVFNDMHTGFVNGGVGTEESVKFGLTGCISHPQVNMDMVNYSDTAWAEAPWQSLQYVSCHDNHTLFDKLHISQPGSSREEIIAMHKLANAVVLTAQGIPFLHAGTEMLRTKQGEHNSYNLPDSINQIDWGWKETNKEVVAYYKNLIQLRKDHPAFRMNSAAEVREHLQFLTTEHGLISFKISNNAHGDPWKNIIVVYNAKRVAHNFYLEGPWKTGVLGDTFNSGEQVSQIVKIPPISMLVLYQE